MRSMIRTLSRFFAAVLMAVPTLTAQDLAQGRIVDRVPCLSAPEWSYALYLPSDYRSGKTWPVLFLFDPGARGATAVEAFRPAAEEYGWILVGSNDSRNGPLDASLRAARAIHADALARFPVDARRVYAAGFSGGARVASLFPRAVGREIAGIIGCGAGLATGVAPADLGAAAYVGLTGLADFNYAEMKALDLAMDAAGPLHRFLFFEGRHEWPGEAVCSRAAAWLEIEAMKGGRRPKDEALARAVVGRELDEAAAFESAGRVFWAADRLEAARRLAEGVCDLPDPVARIEALKDRPEYARFLAAEKKRDRRSAGFRGEFGRAFGAIEGDEAGGGAAVGLVLRETGVGPLKKEARGAKTVEDRGLASRLLFDMSFAAQARAGDLYRAGDLVRAGAYLDVAIAACEEGLAREPGLYFDRACVAARLGDRSRALGALETAIAKGFDDLAALETDLDLAPVRDTDRFRELVALVKKKGSNLNFFSFPI